MMNRFETVVVGVSAGGLEALSVLLPALPKRFSLSMVIVQHRAEEPRDFIAPFLNRLTQIDVREAESGDSLTPGVVYVAPAGYHVHIEMDGTLRLSVDPPVHYARPSIDVLFDSAADVLGNRVVGVVLTGTNADGARGLAKIKACGGLAVVQNPMTARCAQMPRAALEAVEPDYILELEEIGPFLDTLPVVGMCVPQ